jgi:hypothetical protein
MTTAFFSRDIWPQLTKATCRCSPRCAVAVAYFGQGASRLLPLAKGSRLVVDASERSVGSGQTCPTDLIKLVERGVAVYSVPNLHAKVFVLGRIAYIGSANASSRAASHLVEAVIRTNDRKTVRDARQFVQQLCLRELTPEVLKRLAKLWHPPLIPGGKPGTSKRPSLPRFLLAQLRLEDWSEHDQALHDAAMIVAKQRQKHRHRFEVEGFRFKGTCPYRRDDVVVQVTDEGSGSVFVTPAGNLLHVCTRRKGNSSVSFVFLERPALRRRKLNSLARTLGCTHKRRRRNGLIRDSSLAQTLLNTWAVAI